MELFKRLLKIVCLIKYFTKLRFYYKFFFIISYIYSFNKNKKRIINDIYLNIYI